MGNELHEARSSEDDVEQPMIKKSKREIEDDHHGKIIFLFTIFK